MAKRPAAHLKGQKDVKKQEGYQCQVCGLVSKSNHGHHLINYSFGGDPSINNMITLCLECHYKYHSGKLKMDVIRF